MINYTLNIENLNNRKNGNTVKFNRLMKCLNDQSLIGLSKFIRGGMLLMN